MQTDSPVPWWGALLAWATRPVRRMWESHDALDAYAIVQLSSSAADALVAIALADSVFFSVPVGEAKLKVALYLGLTMAPLAVAAPLLVMMLDRGGLLRTIAFGAAAGRSLLAIYAAPRFDSLLLFPLAFLLLVLSKVSGTTKNGLTMAYAPEKEGLVAANARLGRLTVAGVLLAAGPGLAVLRLTGSPGVLYLAAMAYAVTALLTVRLPLPAPAWVRGEVSRLGRIQRLTTAAAGTAALKAAAGFLFFLLAFALRGTSRPAYWFGILAGTAAVGGLLGDVVAPRLSHLIREEAVVFGSITAAGVAALFAFTRFGLLPLAFFAGFSAMATEFGRLAFQSLMQRSAPAGAHGRVFVRYDMLFQLAWVGGALLPALLDFSFRTGVLVMAAFYLALGVNYLLRTVYRG
ncbi:MAG TPA: hypothetical protein VGL18_07240 [Actinomycetota bacterium]